MILLMMMFLMPLLLLLLPVPGADQGEPDQTVLGHGAGQAKLHGSGSWQGARQEEVKTCRRKEPGGRSQDAGARGKEPGGRSKDAGARGKEPGSRGTAGGSEDLQEAGARRRIVKKLLFDQCKLKSELTP